MPVQLTTDIKGSVQSSSSLERADQLNLSCTSCIATRGGESTARLWLCGCIPVTEASAFPLQLSHTQIASTSCPHVHVVLCAPMSHVVPFPPTTHFHLHTHTHTHTHTCPCCPVDIHRMSPVVPFPPMTHFHLYTHTHTHTHTRKIYVHVHVVLLTLAGCLM